MQKQADLTVALNTIGRIEQRLSFAFLLNSAITFTDGADMDSLAAGETCRIQVERDPTHGDDDMSGDAQLMAVLITET